MSGNTEYAKQDEKLLELFRTVPEKAFRQLFDTYYMPLCVYTVQLTDSFDMAEDVVQEVLAYFWEKKYYNRVTGSLRGYLFYAVRNAALLALKKNNLVSMEELSGMKIDIPDEYPDREELYERERQLMADLEKLPRQEVLAVKTVILESKKYKEAAEELQISVNTLKTHLSRALGKLRKNHNLMIFFY